MRCATHPDTEAIAVCRACFKGVCPMCAVPVGRSVACSAQCSADAAKLLRVVAVSGQNAPAVQRTQAVVLLVLAAGCGIAALIATDIGRWVMGIAALLMLLGAVRYFRLAAQWSEVEKK